MSTIRRFQIFLAALALTTSAQATTIGPDSFGYTATDDVPFGFENIAGAGDATFIFDTADDSTMGVSLGFAFEFYGVPFGSVVLGSNGYMTFGGVPTGGKFLNEDLTVQDGPSNLKTVCALWDDWRAFNLQPQSGLWYATRGVSPNRRFIAQWNIWDHFLLGPVGAGGEVTFQAILYEGSNAIDFNYLDLNVGNIAFDDANSATVGIRDVGAHLGNGRVLQWAFNTTKVAPVVAGKTIRFTPATNEAPECSGDFTLADANFLVSGQYVVTEGETISVDFTGTDADGDPLTASLSGPGSLSVPSGPEPLLTTWSWTPIAADEPGAPYTIAVTFEDDDGATATCTFDIADINLKPVAVCAQTEITVECTSSLGAEVSLDGSGSFDPDLGDVLLYQWDVSDLGVSLDDPTSATPTGIFPEGITMATLTVVDQRGGVSTCDVVVTVEDTTPPEVMCTTNIAKLWPPNHTMRPVQVIVTATDVCAAPEDILPIIVTVSSDEPDNAPGGGDGNTTGDVNGSDGYAAPVVVTGMLTYSATLEAHVGTIMLRAERAGSGDGRKYTIDVAAFDDDNNMNTASCVVVVPHDKRPGGCP